MRTRWSVNKPTDGHNPRQALGGSWIIHVSALSIPTGAAVCLSTVGCVSNVGK